MVCETSPPASTDMYLENAPMTNTPAAFSKAHMRTAGLGLIALVVTAVAIELGPSVHPLTKTTPKLINRAM